MATNFFERQEQARSHTVKLIVIFVVALVALVAVTGGATYFALQYWAPSRDSATSEQLQWIAPLGIGGLTAVIVVLGSLFKIVMLRRGGGRSVAETLGGRQILPNTEDLEEMRILNVVEEMAIAAGVPVPPVYLLNDEESINAFAAGYSPQDAVVGITRGAVHALSRDELQGVVAHEFSHILNGDMRLGIRLIGILHGILLLGLAGRAIFHIVGRGSVGRSRSSSSKGGGGGQVILIMLAAALVLIIVGSLGALIGNLVKAAISRQREYLADASAIQFTRNSQGLSGALKQIGARVKGSALESPNAAQASHMYFASGLSSGFASYFSTHPPLPKRILAIDPQWDGKFPVVRQQASVASTDYRAAASGPAAAGLPLAGLAAAAPGGSERSSRSQPNDEVETGSGRAEQDWGVDELRQAIAHVGDPETPHREYARNLIDSIPEALLKVARDPYSARALIFALLVDRDREVLGRQIEALKATIDLPLVELVVKLIPHCQNLEARQRFPLVDLTVPALRAMTEAQFERFHTSFWALVRADDRINLFEWTLAQIIERHLSGLFRRIESPVTRYYGLQRLGKPLSLLLSLLAHTGHDQGQSRQAFELASRLLGEVDLQWMPREACNLDDLNQALRKLRTTSPKLRQRIVDACLTVICADGIAKTAEAELLRGICDLIDCPVPPILPGQRTPNLIASR